jgi:hypothetical protein
VCSSDLGVYDGAGNNPAGETVYLDLNGNDVYDGSGQVFYRLDAGDIVFTDQDAIEQTYVGMEALTSAITAEAVQDFVDDTDQKIIPGFVDLSDPWLDMNEDGIRQAHEPFIDFNNNEQFNSANGRYDGFLCEDNGHDICGATSTYVRRALPIIMASSDANYWVRNTTDNCIVKTNIRNILNISPECDEISITLTSGGSKSFEVYVSDTANQTMPSGTRISSSVTAGELTGATQIDITNNINNHGRRFFLTILDNNTEREEAELSALNILITTPKGHETAISIGFTILAPTP